MNKLNTSMLIFVFTLILVSVCPAFSMAAEEAVTLKDQRERARQISEDLTTERKLKSQEKEIISVVRFRRGLDFYEKGNIEEARKEFEIALEYDHGNKSARKYLKIINSDIELGQREKSKLIFEKAVKLSKEGRYEEALVELDSILAREEEYYKDEAESYRETVEQRILSGEQKEEISLAAQERRKKEEEIQQYVIRGKQYYNHDEFGKAIGEWENILRMTAPEDFDYNMANALIQKARRKQLQTAGRDVGREAELTEKIMVLESKKRWLLSDRDTEDVPEETKKEEVQDSRHRILAMSKQEISLDTKKKHLRDVLEHLSSISGVNLVLDDAVFSGDDDGESASPYVTMSLKDIPLLEALDVILRAKGLKYRVEDSLIWITTVETLEQEEFVSKVFRIASGAGDSIKDVITETVSQPEGSSVNFDDRSGMLMVTNTPSNMEIIKEIVLALDETPIQVFIQAKFIEIENSFLEEFTRGIVTTGDVNISGAGGEDGKFTSGLGEVVTAVTDETLSFTYTDPENVLSWGLEALATTGKGKILSSPQLTTLNNQSANIDITRSVSFVESYDIETTTYQVGDNDLQISSLRSGETGDKKTGVMLKVTPSVGGDRKTINLTLVPEVTELTGWVETTYGYLDSAVLKRPIFYVRRVNTSVIIEDGETVILGGLASEAETKYKDRVPLVSNIPVLGNLLGRDTKSSSTTSLLILITAKILTPDGTTYK